ncbi:MAG TPA: chemotaxis protein CheW [Lacipirellulaceae bacterium]|nr:chemotaxis protein CheW [Lacipirellulaceae bacterium]
MGAEKIQSRRGRYLIFHLSERTYAISIRNVSEVLAETELSWVPGSPSFLTGFLNVGEELIAVISLRRLWGIPDRERELYSPLILLRSESQQVALEVDRVSRIVDIADEDLVGVSEGSALNDSAISIARVDGTNVVLLSPSRLLLEEERRRIAELTELAQRRLTAAEGVTA